MCDIEPTTKWQATISVKTSLHTTAEKVVSNFVAGSNENGFSQNYMYRHSLSAGETHLKQHSGVPVYEWSVANVRMSNNPAKIRGSQPCLKMLQVNKYAVCPAKKWKSVFSG